jgi:Zn-dependent peptidase ImmA (M78 family)
MTRAERAARKLLVDAKVTAIPIPTDQLIEYLGAKLTLEPFEGDISGMLFREPSTVVIGVNSAHSTTRRRFTIAHEIGHLILHQGRSIIVDKFVRVNFRDNSSSLGTDREEIEANSFAAELLMPEEMVRQEMHRRLSKRTSASNEQIIRQLARTFDVSPEAMEYRLINLGMCFPK